jgi:peptidoglycan/LPS O-acetylase OafA/YrhL
MTSVAYQTNQDWRSRIDERFTALRGYAALSVVLAHYQYMGFFPFLHFFKFSAQCSLFLFFFLSSFLLSHSLLHGISAGDRPISAILKYSINRIFRIFPLFILVVSVCYWTDLAFFDSATTTYFGALGLSLTLGKAPSVLWTIPVELTFYVWLPAILAATVLLTRSRVGAAALAVSYIAWCLGISLALHLGVSSTLWITLGFHHYANSFVGGVVLYALVYNGHIQFPKSGKAFAYAAPCLFFAAYPFFYFPIVQHDFWIEEFKDVNVWAAYYKNLFPFAPLVVGGVIYGLLHPSETLLCKAMRIGFLRKFGEWSFGIYLVHIPMLAFINARFGYGQWQFEIALAATLAAAAILSRIVEKPAIALGREIGRRILSRIETKPTALSPARLNA